MRKQIVSGMLLLLLLILPVSLYLQIDRSFQQSVSGARESALREEAAIARSLMMEVRRGTETEEIAVRQAAQKIAQQFDAGHLRILVYLDQTPLAEKLPEQFSGFLEATQRSTFLSSEVNRQIKGQCQTSLAMGRLCAWNSRVRRSVSRTPFVAAERQRSTWMLGRSPSGQPRI